ncbi:AMP-binding protein [Actinomadura rugatobispora]|uniref:AMP-binding protein n=1 Tax=Actinomadura rugatobispora TaxID=1994 RepID=A0ABW0ZX72_9ACTN|nr:hypothetical protein GCM10010200_101300 [Actinomadura rugatobispora]
MTSPAPAQAPGPLPDLDRTPLVQRLARWARQYPDDRAYTYVDYSGDVEGVHVDITWAELDARSRAVAAALRRTTHAGRRAAILAPQNLDYVIAFLGAMYARVIAVPLFSPDLPGHADRLTAVYGDAEPECVLTTTEALPHVEAFFDGTTLPRPKAVLNVDEVDRSLSFEPEPIAPDDLAYLQYVAGTAQRAEPRLHLRPQLRLRVPGHQGRGRGEGRPRPQRRPGLHERRRDHPRRHPHPLPGRLPRPRTAPRGPGARLRAGRGDGVRVLFLPLPPAHRQGLRPRRPQPRRPAALRPRRRTRLGHGRLRHPYGQYVAIADPATGERRPDGRVGEIWVHGPNITAGYWGRPEATAETFQAVLAGDRGGLPERPWLRTGDLGVWYEGELYVTGRIKDLVIIDGRNHYPHDIEHTAYNAHEGVRREYAAAFAVAGRDTENLVVVAERNRRVPVRRLDPREVTDAVRAAVKHHHDVRVHELVLIEPGGLPRTSSGKVSRTACRRAYLDGTLPLTRTGPHPAA